MAIPILILYMFRLISLRFSQELKNLLKLRFSLRVGPFGMKMEVEPGHLLPMQVALGIQVRRLYLTTTTSIRMALMTILFSHCKLPFSITSPSYILMWLMRVGEQVIQTPYKLLFLLIALKPSKYFITKGEQI